MRLHLDPQLKAKRERRPVEYTLQDRTFGNFIELIWKRILEHKDLLEQKYIQIQHH